jgi:hypothetical protein
LVTPTSELDTYSHVTDGLHNDAAEMVAGQFSDAR